MDADAGYVVGNNISTRGVMTRPDLPVTDFIPLPHLLANPTCQVGHSCVLMCNLADLALWGSVPLLALAFVWHVLDDAASRRRVTAV